MLDRERNLLISAGTGSGKTTLLNALVSLLPADGRIIIYGGHAGAPAAPRQLPAVRGAGGARRLRRDDPRPGGTRCATGRTTSSSARSVGPRPPTCFRRSTPATAAASPPSTRTTPPLRCRALRTAPCRHPMPCRGRWSAAGWSTASRPSFIRRGLPKGCAGSSRWSASATTTPEPTAGSSSPSGRRGPTARETPRRRRSGGRDPHRGGSVGGGEGGEPPACGRFSDRARSGAGRRTRAPAAGGPPPVRADRVLRACERYVVLDLAALAAPFGWKAPLDALRRRLTCRQCGARTSRVSIGCAGPAREGTQPMGGCREVQDE